MKRFIILVAIVCLLLSMSVSVFAADSTQVYALDFISSAEQFLSEVLFSSDVSLALSTQDEIWLGKEIPCYVQVNEFGKYDRAHDSVYPVISKDTVIGLLGVSRLEDNRYAFSYTEGMIDEINSVNGRIAIVFDGISPKIISETTYFKNFDSLKNKGIEFSDTGSKATRLQISGILNETNTSGVANNKAIPNSYKLNVPQKKQSHAAACWAACIASVAQYKLGKTYSCQDIINLSRIAAFATMEQVRTVLRSKLHINVSAVGERITMSSLKNCIYSGKPILGGFSIPTGFNSYSNVGHMMVIRGYDTVGSPKLTLMDPSNGTYIFVSIISEYNMSFTYYGNTWCLRKYLIVG